jgi:hypothetical protein
MSVTGSEQVEQVQGHEDTPQETLTKRRTPLPKFQLVIVYLIQFTEPITALVIFPFINQYVHESGITGGDQRKTGYYAGIIVSFLSWFEKVIHSKFSF